MPEMSEQTETRVVLPYGEECTISETRNGFALQFDYDSGGSFGITLTREHAAQIAKALSPDTPKQTEQDSSRVTEDVEALADAIAARFDNGCAHLSPDEADSAVRVLDALEAAQRENALLKGETPLDWRGECEWFIWLDAKGRIDRDGHTKPGREFFAEGGVIVRVVPEKRLQEKDAEITRLREALEAIAGGTCVGHDPPPDPTDCPKCCARAALEGEQGEATQTDAS